MTAQLVIGAIAVTVGLITAGWLCRTLRTRLRSNGETLWDTRGRAIPFTMINGVEKKRWESKGLADVFYEANGRHGKVRFDDYKYAGCEKIFAEIEQHLASRAPGADGGGDKSGAG